MQELDFLQSPRLESLRIQAEESQKEEDRKRFLALLIREILQALGNVTVKNIKEGVNVNNLDEIKASLRNELSKANKPLTEILNKLNLSTQEQTKFLKEVEAKAEEEVDDSVQTVVVKRLKDKVEVTNLDEIVIPKDISVNNLAALEQSLEQLIEKISALKLEVTLPAPQVTVEPTPVNIPETVLNVPAVDLEPIIFALEKNLKLLRTNNKSNPLAVRLTNGSEWIKELQTLNKNAAQTTQYMSDVSYLRDVSGQRINPATAEGQGGANAIGDGSKNVTSAGTRVQLSATSIPCRYVIIVGLVTNTDTIWVGGSTVAAGRGRPLVALQSEKIDVNDVSKVWIDSVVNGEGVSYAYVA